MEKWKIEVAADDFYKEERHQNHELQRLLSEGYEPFGVTTENRVYMGNDTEVFVYHLKKLS